MLAAAFLTAFTLPFLKAISRVWDCGSQLAELYRLTDSGWHIMVPFEHSGKAALAALLGATTWYPLNSFFNDDDEIDRVIQDRKDPLEMLLRTAMGRRSLVSLTMKSGKIYVGFIASNLNPAFPMESVSMIPAMSGSRENNKKVVNFTTLYSDAYARIEEEITLRVKQEAKEKGLNLSEAEIEERIREEVDIELEDFKFAFPITEIQSANIFRMEIYNKYFRVGQLHSPFSGKEKDTRFPYE